MRLVDKKLKAKAERELLQEWLQHPGTRLMARKLRRLSWELLMLYDEADDNERREIASMRKFLNKDLPEKISEIVNKGRRSPFSIFSILGLKKD